MGEPLRLRICVIRRALTPAGRPRTRWRADAPERRKTAEQRPRQGGPTSPCPSRVGSFDPLGSCREQWAATYGNQAQARARSRRLDSHGAGPPVSTATPVRTSDSGYERASAAAGAGLTAALLALEWLVAGRKRSQQRVDAALKEWNWSPSQVLIATTGRHPTPEYDPRASTLARRWHRRHLPPASAPTERRVTRHPGPPSAWTLASERKRAHRWWRPRAGSAARRQCRLLSRWSPRRPLRLAHRPADDRQGQRARAQSDGAGSRREQERRSSRSRASRRLALVLSGRARHRSRTGSHAHWKRQCPTPGRPPARSDPSP
jgi:hypothetical protein